MIQDEAARRDQKKYDLRLRRSGFRGDKTLDLHSAHLGDDISVISRDLIVFQITVR